MNRFAVPCEFKALPDEDGVFEGYGSVWGVIDSYADIVAKGAFKRSLKEYREKKRMPAMLYQHDPDRPIGIYEDVREDEKGLYVRGRLALKTQFGAETYELMRIGALSGLSIGFRTRKSQIDDETGIRTLTDIDLYEVSPVLWPANDEARVMAVKANGELPTEREFERWIRREGGFTEDQAKAIISKGYRQVRREAMPSEEACEGGLRLLLDSLRQRAAIFTGEGNGGTHAAGSEAGD